MSRLESNDPAWDDLDDDEDSAPEGMYMSQIDGDDTVPPDDDDLFDELDKLDLFDGNEDDAEC